MLGRALCVGDLNSMVVAHKLLQPLIKLRNRSYTATEINEKDSHLRLKIVLK